MEFPVVDVDKKIITGCSPGSEAYAHEEKHIEFAQSAKGQSMDWIFEMSMFYTIVCLVVAQFLPIFKWFSVVTIAIGLFVFIYEEIWCNWFPEIQKKVTDEMQTDEFRKKVNK